jgi:hypothetical protein
MARCVMHRDAHRLMCGTRTAVKCACKWCVNCVVKVGSGAQFCSVARTHVCTTWLARTCILRSSQRHNCTSKQPQVHVPLTCQRLPPHYIPLKSVSQSDSTPSSPAPLYEHRFRCTIACSPTHGVASLSRSTRTFAKPFRCPLCDTRRTTRTISPTPQAPHHLQHHIQDLQHNASLRYRGHAH